MDYNISSQPTGDETMAMTEEEKKQSHSRSSIKYDANNTTMLHVKLNHTTDKDILDHLATVPNKQGYIKDLIRKDIDADT